MTPAELCRKWQDRGGWAEDRALRRCTFPMAPRNTWSNAAYPLAGLVALLLYEGPLPAAAGIHLVGMTFLGLTSGWYHGTKRWVPNLFDRAGMFAVFVPLALHGIAPGHPATVTLMVLGGLGAAALFPAVVPGLSVNTTMGAAVLVAAIPAFLFGAPALAGAGLLLLALAKLCWVLDRRASPLVGLWGHALWHVLSAAGTSLIFLAQVG